MYAEREREAQIIDVSSQNRTVVSWMKYRLRDVSYACSGVITLPQIHSEDLILQCCTLYFGAF